MLRRAADGTYSAAENVDVAVMLASVRAISLRGNSLCTLDGLQFCTNLRALDVCYSFACRACAAVVRASLFVELCAMTLASLIRLRCRCLSANS